MLKLKGKCRLNKYKKGGVDLTYDIAVYGLGVMGSNLAKI